MKISSFDWDAGNLGKLKKHKIPIETIEGFFNSPVVNIANDFKHTLTESRYIAYGKYNSRRLFIAFTFRAIEGVLKIRVISARFLHDDELRRLHEENKS